MAVLFTQPYQQFFDANGNPLAGGKIATYEAGTTTPKAAYANQSETTVLPNPIILDAAGRATIWIVGNYRYQVRDANDALIADVDNVTAFNVTGSSLTVVTTTGDQTIAGVKTFSDFNNSYGFAIGQCRLVRVPASTNIRLDPFNGNKILINGVWRSIPDAGVTLSSSGQPANTNLYIYAFWSGSAIALEASTTAPAVQAGTGLRIKTGDATRTLVGMARTTASDWETSPLLVRSYFNRPQSLGTAAFTADRSTTSTSSVEINTEIRVNFLVWADEVASAAVRGSCNNSGVNGVTRTGIGFNGATPEDGITLGQAYAASAIMPAACVATEAGLAEGTLHYATLIGSVSAGTGTWFGTAGVFRTTLEVTI